MGVMLLRRATTPSPVLPCQLEYPNLKLLVAVFVPKGVFSEDLEDWVGVGLLLTSISVVVS